LGGRTKKSVKVETKNTDTGTVAQDGGNHVGRPGGGKLLTPDDKRKSEKNKKDLRNTMCLSNAIKKKIMG